MSVERCDAGAQVLEMKVGRHDAVFHGHSRTDQAGKTGGTLSVSVR